MEIRHADLQIEVEEAHDSQAMPDDRMEPGIEPTLF